ncbi:RNA polymerase sigma factor [candidate division KSB1 bacterium]
MIKRSGSYNKQTEYGVTFRELVDKHKRSIYYLALKLTGDHHSAEDISQEVFIKLYKSLDKIKGESKLSTWLYRVTVNTWISSTRKRSVSMLSYKDNTSLMNMEKEYDNSGIQLSSHNPNMESIDLKDHIENALNKITDKERAVFVLRHYEDLPLKEIAKVLKIAEGTVKSLLFRAIKKLQKELSFYVDHPNFERAE